MILIVFRFEIFYSSWIVFKEISYGPFDECPFLEKEQVRKKLLHFMDIVNDKLAKSMFNKRILFYFTMYKIRL